MAKKTQIQKFRDMARELEVEETEGRFNAALKQVAKHRESEKPKPSRAGSLPKRKRAK